MIGPTWMEDGTPPVFPRAGFRNPVLESWQRYDKAVTVVELAFPERAALSD
jgi:hypothetical protein